MSSILRTTLSPASHDPLETWLRYLERPQTKLIHLDLARISAVGKKMPELKTPAPTIFVVGGTNGKGTTCCTLEQISLAANYRVGTFTSPHLLCYNERIRINGHPVSDDMLRDALAWIEANRGAITLTYFEHTTLAALKIFEQAKLDIVVLEIGLGGRLDAVNWVEPTVSILTNVAIDHQARLGPTREAIGYEKAGIFRSKIPAILGESDLPNSVMTRLQELDPPIFRYGKEWWYTTRPLSWEWNAENGNRLDALPYPQVPIQNAALAVTALMQVDRLDISHAAIQKGLHQAALPGRFHCIQKSPRVILDVAHNPKGGYWLANRLIDLGCKPKTLHCVTAMLGDKAIEETLEAILPLTKRWYIAPLPVERGAGALTRLIHYLPPEHTYTYEAVDDAYQTALNAAKEDETILCFGSFHTVAAILRFTGHHPNLRIPVCAQQSAHYQLNAQDRFYPSKLHVSHH